jgi:hypothetical protein
MNTSLNTRRCVTFDAGTTTATGLIVADQIRLRKKKNLITVKAFERVAKLG